MGIGRLLTLFFYFGFEIGRVKDGPEVGKVREERFGKWVKDQSASSLSFFVRGHCNTVNRELTLIPYKRLITPYENYIVECEWS